MVNPMCSPYNEPWIDHFTILSTSCTFQPFCSTLLDWFTSEILPLKPCSDGLGEDLRRAMHCQWAGAKRAMEEGGRLVSLV